MPENYYLWLDESGQFGRNNDGVFVGDNSDEFINYNPSLVGGLLLQESELDKDTMISILNNGMSAIGLKDEKFVKSSDLNDNHHIKGEKLGLFAVTVINDLVANDCKPVIFENTERLGIVDSTITYLNIIAEGIVQLLMKLNAENDTFFLKVIIATRRDMEDGKDKHGRIQTDEYKIRLEEKICIAMARNSITGTLSSQYSIHFKYANFDMRLKFADIVCNTWLTRTSEKFNDEDRQTLMKLYSEEYRFSIYENVVSEMVKSGDISGALFAICTTDEMNENHLQLVADRLCSHGVNIQIYFDTLNSKITSLLKIDRDLNKSKSVLIRLQDEVIPHLKERDIPVYLLPLDVCIHLTAVYSHEGDVINAEKQFKKFMIEFNRSPKQIKLVDYYFIYKIRYAVHLMNCFDYKGTIDETTEVIDVSNKIMGAISTVEMLRNQIDNTKSDIVAKARGTRLQAYSQLIRKDKTAYDCAIEDSVKVIEEFVSDSDVKRQYQYRAQIECDAGNIMESLRWLLKAVDVDLVDNDIDVSLKKFFKTISIKDLFILMQYTRIIAEATVQRELPIADKLYSYLCDEIDVYTQIRDIKSKDHPVEIILWKIATYLAIKGKIKEADVYYNSAVEICFIDYRRLTINAIGLGILAEKAALTIPIYYRQNSGITKNEFKVIDELSRHFNAFITTKNLPESMRNYFAKWKTGITEARNEKDIKLKTDILFDLSREIAY